MSPGRGVVRPFIPRPPRLSDVEISKQSLAGSRATLIQEGRNGRRGHQRRRQARSVEAMK